MHGVHSITCQFDHHVGGDIDHIRVVARSTDHRVSPGATAERVGGAVAPEDVVQRVAGSVDGRGADQRQVLDVRTERPGHERLNRVVPAGRQVGRYIQCTVDDISVVAPTAIEGIVAAATVQKVVAEASVELIVAGQAVDPVVGVESGDDVVACGAVEARCQIGERCRVPDGSVAEPQEVDLCGGAVEESADGDFVSNPDRQDQVRAAARCLDIGRSNTRRQHDRVVDAAHFRDHVLAVTRGEAVAVVALSTFEGVVARAAGQGVITVGSENHVVAGQPRQAVAVRRAQQYIVASRGRVGIAGGQARKHCRLVQFRAVRQLHGAQETIGRYRDCVHEVARDRQHVRHRDADLQIGAGSAELQFIGPHVGTQQHPAVRAQALGGPTVGPIPVTEANRGIAIAGQQVIARTPVDHIGAAERRDRVVAVATQQHVGIRRGAHAVEDHVIACAAVELVVEAVADDPVVGAGADHVRTVGVVGQRHVLDIAVGRELVGLVVHRGVHVHHHGVGAFSGKLLNGDQAVFDVIRVVAGAADKGVDAAAAVEHIVAGQS